MGTKASQKSNQINNRKPRTCICCGEREIHPKNHRLCRYCQKKGGNSIAYEYQTFPHFGPMAPAR